MSTRYAWSADGPRKRVPTCMECGVPVHEDATHCDLCRLETFKRMLMLREYLVRTMDDPHCELPYTYRTLS